MRRRSISALFGLLAAALTAAQPAPAAEPRWPAAMQGGAPKLAAYALARERPKGAGAYLAGFQRVDGLNHHSGHGLQQISGYFRIAPLLDYDDNWNNGLHGSEFRAGGLVLRVAEDDRAKPGAAIGAAVSAGVTFSVAKGHVVSLDGRLGYQEAVDYDLSRRDRSLRLCTERHVAAFTWIDACASHRVIQKVTRSEENSLSLGATHLVSSPLADHQLRLSATRLFADDYVQSRVTLGAVSAVAGLGAVTTELTLGQKVEGELALRWSARLGLGREILGRRVNTSLQLSEQDGGSVFGQAREDRTALVHVSTGIGKGVRVGLGYKKTWSSVDIYDREGPVFDISLKSFKF